MAVRDATLGGITIRTGDSVAILGKEIVLSDKSPLSCAKRLADLMIGENENGQAELSREKDNASLDAEAPPIAALLIFSGNSANTGDSETLMRMIRDERPEIEIYRFDGGQGIYQYILVTIYRGAIF